MSLAAMKLLSGAIKLREEVWAAWAETHHLLRLWARGADSHWPSKHRSKGRESPRRNCKCERPAIVSKYWK